MVINRQQALERGLAIVESQPEIPRGPRWLYARQIADAITAAVRETAEECAGRAQRVGDTARSVYKGLVIGDYFQHRGDPHIKGRSDAAHELADSIRQAYAITPDNGAKNGEREGA